MVLAAPWQEKMHLTCLGLLGHSAPVVILRYWEDKKRSLRPRVRMCAFGRQIRSHLVQVTVKDFN